MLVLLPDLLLEGLSKAGEVRALSACAPARCDPSENTVGDCVALAADAIASAKGLVLTDNAERSGNSEPWRLLRRLRRSRMPLADESLTALLLISPPKGRVEELGSPTGSLLGKNPFEATLGPRFFVTMCKGSVALVIGRIG